MAERVNELQNFFAAWFPDADIEGFRDQEVVRRYLQTVSNEERLKVLAQCEEVLSSDPLPLDFIANEAWRQFDTQAEAREWLQTIKRELSLVASV